ncbi:MAG: efflux RND transporter periplasmic adaptor subunit [Akkermansiaceae bacterium]|nr:efflux RND transporter periplasmic adaptor subunit [Akkermansiaceae bacterium]
MKAYNIFALALSGLAAVSFTACRDGADDGSQAQRQMSPLKVEVMNMVQRDVELKSSWFGYTRGVEQADICPQVTGTLIRQVYWDGSICEKGELLFEIDPSVYKAAVDQAAANLGAAKAAKLQAEAAREKARQDVARYEPLVKSGSVSEKNYTDALQTLKEADATLEQAKASIGQAEANLASARINLDRTQVRAPFRGLASKATASVGDLLAANGKALTTMSSIDPIRVDFSVSDKQALAKLMADDIDLKKGTLGMMPEFELILSDGSVYNQKGKVVSVDSEVSRASGTISFIGHVPNPGYKLRSGMGVRVRAVTAKVPNALLVPKRAVVTEMNHRNIYVVAPDQTPRRIDVQLGETLTLDMPDGKGGTAPMLMQIVTGTVKPVEESLREMGYDNPSDAPVIVIGSAMAAQYSKANSLITNQLKESGAEVDPSRLGRVNPSAYIYTKPESTTPSITAQ